MGKMASNFIETEKIAAEENVLCKYAVRTTGTNHLS